MLLLLLACTSVDAPADDRPPRDERPPLEGDTDTDADSDTDTDADADTDTDTDTDADLPSSGGSGGALGLHTGSVGSSAYTLYAPPCLGEDAAVVFAMHGSGGDGASMVQSWRSLAEAACFAVVGLDSETGASWNFSGDVDNFARLYDLLDADYDVALRYLHGYSAGAHWTYIIGISNSDAFSGLGVYAGSLSYAEQWGYWPDPDERPIPVAIAHGGADTTVPVSEATHAEAELLDAGWPVDARIDPAGTHAYDPACQQAAWDWWEAQR